ncbi:MAG: flagellar biosynthetic protein FliR [Chromatiales bacterium]|jgi:flagellar biosynthetic protein FliR|nr:flagellar biosynthetic protein FliR [Chromatiales bacterium]
MNIPLEQLTAWVTAFLWPFFRIGALIMVAPIFGARTVPMFYRIGLAAMITLVVFPLLPEQTVLDPLSPEGILITASQIFIGLVMGFFVRLVFAAVETGGSIIGQTMGLGFAQMMDPSNGVSVPVVSQFYNVMATLVFLALNGHLILIEMLVESFKTIPISTQGITENGLWLLVTWAAWIFKGAMIIALPAIAAMLLVNIAFGVMMRAAPQLNIFAVGFPVTLMLGFIVIMVSLSMFVPQFMDLMDGAFLVMHEALVP